MAKVRWHMRRVSSLGHSQAVAIAATTLSLLGASYQILPERSASAPALRGRNVVLIADTQNSNNAAERLEATPLTLEYDAAVQDVVVRERAGSHTVWAGKRGQGSHDRGRPQHYPGR